MTHWMEMRFRRKLCHSCHATEEAQLLIPSFLWLPGMLAQAEGARAGLRKVL